MDPYAKGVPIGRRSPLQRGPYSTPIHSTRISARDAPLAIAKLIVTIGLISVCFWVVDLKGVSRALADVAPGYLALAFVLSVLGTIVLPAVSTKLALGIECISLSFRELLAINFATRLYVIILPRFVSLGIRWLRYGKGQLSHDAFALMSFERVVQLTTLFVLSFIAVSLEIPQLQSWGPAILWATGVGAITSIALLSPFIIAQAARILSRVSRQGGRILPALFASKLRLLSDAVTAFRTLSKIHIVSIICISMLSFMLFIFSAYIVAKALSIEISFLALIWVRSLVFVLTMIPIAVAGIGIREIGFVSLLGIYGISATDALVFSLVNFGLQLAIAAIGATLEAPRIIRYLMKRWSGANNHGGKAT